MPRSPGRRLRASGASRRDRLATPTAAGGAGNEKEAKVLATRRGSLRFAMIPAVLGQTACVRQRLDIARACHVQRVIPRRFPILAQRSVFSTLFWRLTSAPRGGGGRGRDGSAGRGKQRRKERQGQRQGARTPQAETEGEAEAQAGANRGRKRGRGRGKKRSGAAWPSQGFQVRPRLAREPV